MKMQHLSIALERYDQGDFKTTRQHLYAFAIGHRYYPLRAVVNYARRLAGKSEGTTVSCADIIKKLLNVQITKVYFDGTGPVTRNSTMVVMDYLR
ncbi:MAG: hypothetical protein JST46_10440 [Bacteroidetes bacterium]|nr:hypothetical protein [Bacteroidota bacterium]